MKIGCPTEIKPQEHRVGLVPSSVKILVEHGHAVIVQSGAGKGINFSDADYEEAGAEIVSDAASLFAAADLIVKVKEPQAQECRMLRPGQVLFTYLHLAADPAQAKALIESGCVAIAYETVTGEGGRGLPLLQPMSEIAGRLAPVVGANFLQKHLGGNGRLISGVPGVAPARIAILGGGVAGFNAARVAVGMGADVTILEKNHDRLRYLDDYFRGQARVIYSSLDYIDRNAHRLDLIIGAVLIPGASAPRLVARDHLKLMAPGTVVVDIAIDQGGCFETSRATTHADPVYVVEGVVHYCVANMPGAVPLSSTLALNHAVLPYLLQLADKGWRAACLDNRGLETGLNIVSGKVAHANVAAALGMDCADPRSFLTN